MMNPETLKTGRDRAYRAVEGVASDHAQLDLLLATVVAAISSAAAESSLYDVVRATLKDESCLRLRRPMNFVVIVSRIARAFAFEHGLSILPSEEGATAPA
jgi:hypothetical protein